MKTLISLGAAVTLATPLMFNTTPVHAVEVDDAGGLDYEECHRQAVQGGVVVPLCGGGGYGGGDYGGGDYGGGDYGGGDYGGGDYGGGDYGGGDYGGGDYGGGDYGAYGGADNLGEGFVPPLAAYLAQQAAQQAFLRLAIMVASLEASNGAVFDPMATDEEVEQAFD